MNKLWLLPAVGLLIFLGFAVGNDPHLPQTKVVTVWDDEKVPNMNHGDTLNIKRESSMDPDDDYFWCDSLGGILDTRVHGVVVCRDVDF